MTMPDVSGLPENIDATYTDDVANPSRKLHQQHHDLVHAAIKAAKVDLAAKLDTATASSTYETQVDAAATYLAQTTGAGLTPGAVRSRLVANVKDYGATGDGVADDTAEIQAAIDAVLALGGGTVYLPKGTYKISAALNGKANVSLEGDGQFATIITTATTLIRMISYENVNTYGVRIERLTISGVTGASGTTGIYFGSTLEETAHVYLSELRIVNHAKGTHNGGSWGLFDATYNKVDFLSCSEWGVEVAGSQVNLIGCTFRLCRWGMLITYLNSNSIGGPRCFGCTWVGSTAFDIVLNGATIRPSAFTSCWFEQCATAVIGTLGGNHLLLGMKFDTCIFQPAATASGTGIVSLGAGTIKGILTFDACVVYTSPLAGADLPGTGFTALVDGESLHTRRDCIRTNGTTVTPLPDLNKNRAINWFNVYNTHKYANDAAAGTAGLVFGQLYYNTTTGSVSIKN